MKVEDLSVGFSYVIQTIYGNDNPVKIKVLDKTKTTIQYKIEKGDTIRHLFSVFSLKYKILEEIEKSDTIFGVDHTKISESVEDWRLYLKNHFKK